MATRCALFKPEAPKLEPLGLVLLALLLLSAKSEASVATEDGEVGIVDSAGNSNSQSYSFKDAASYAFGADLFKLYGHFLSASSNGIDSAKNWDLGLRYEHTLRGNLASDLGQNVEADTFSGFTQRYNTDAGVKYTLIKEERLRLSTEWGYRFSVQNTLDGNSAAQHFIRVYSQISRDWSGTFNTRYDLEILPNLTDSALYRINTSFSASAGISSIFSIKLTYGVKFNNSPPPGVVYKTDSVFTTALVSQFDTEKNKKETGP